MNQAKAIMLVAEIKEQIKILEQKIADNKTKLLALLPEAEVFNHWQDVAKLCNHNGYYQNNLKLYKDLLKDLDES